MGYKLVFCKDGSSCSRVFSIFLSFKVQGFQWLLGWLVFLFSFSPYLPFSLHFILRVYIVAPLFKFLKYIFYFTYQKKKRKKKKKKKKKRKENIYLSLTRAFLTSVVFALK